MTDQDEEYIHFAACIQRLNGAWLTLNAIKAESEQRHPLLGAAFRFALVEYAAAYNKSDGRIKKGRKARRLDSSFVPSEFLSLHQRILDARNQVLTHTDLTVMDAKLYINETQGRRCVTIARNISHGTEEFGHLESSIKLIEGTLDGMYAKQELLKQALKA